MKHRLTLAVQGPHRPSPHRPLLAGISRGQAIAFLAVASWLAAALAVTFVLRAAALLARHAGL